MILAIFTLLGILALIVVVSASMQSSHISRQDEEEMRNDGRS